MESIEVFHALHPVLLDLFQSVEVGPSHALERGEVATLGGLIFLLKAVEDVADAETRARDLVGIGRADALARGTDLRFALGGLDGAVENAVGWHDEVGFLRDVEALAQGMAGLLKALGLIHKQVGGEHDTIADNVHLAPLENAGGNGAEHVFLTIKLQGVSRVRAALEARHGVVAWCEDINYLSLAFIAPLETQEDVNFTCFHRCFYLIFSCFPVFFFSDWRVMRCWQRVQTP